MQYNMPEQIPHLYMYHNIEENIKLSITLKSIYITFSSIIQLLFVYLMLICYMVTFLNMLFLTPMILKPFLLQKI
jgi:ABC-type multidrug transport system permease subunit